MHRVLLLLLLLQVLRFTLLPSHLRLMLPVGLRERTRSAAHSGDGE
jgi:hypothetical protein